MHKVRCNNEFNCPVFLFAEDGSRADIPSLAEFEGELDDRQHDAYLALIKNGRLIDLPVKVAKQKADKDVGLRD